jgi:hypothetical protein
LKDWEVAGAAGGRVESDNRQLVQELEIGKDQGFNDEVPEYLESKHDQLQATVAN